ncbi:hypothetical protein BKA58DRAFT_148154 [Alternaria rosae]|uniref:uncharacterized protein n=1 Tax=Alternaria rosae TaxID=1187941 RepID=UPI001E8E340D|nr:uncharacterized protein BKA58DRAFT_148154 [Alternaria rosae]KAH6872553.1 hypothetical protein BKA58DRAFT_148154 [Alternaria rosae]
MCRIEQREEFTPDGRPLTSSRACLCAKARGDKPCRDAVIVPIRYIPRSGSMGRDNTPSPTNPPTPTTSTYLVQTRRPSGSGSRPSTRDGQRPISNEIIIEFGTKKDRGKKYPLLSVSTKPYDRSSLGSIGSHDIAVDSVGSDASYTYRTGLPEAPLPPPATFDHHSSYLTTPTAPYGQRSRHIPSASSSQTPSLYVASDAEYDPPARQRSTKRSSTVIHNPPTVIPSSPPQRQGGMSSGSYRTTKVAPRETYTSDHPHPLDYDAFADHSNSSYTSSGAPEGARRAKTGDERQKQSKSSRHQEESDRRLADERDKADTARRVHFEPARADNRAKERAETLFAEKEKDRALAREESRRVKEEERLRQERRDLEAKKAQDRKKEKSSPPTIDYTKKRPGATRRLSSSMTSAQLEQQRLIKAEEQQMRSERQIAEAREREEELAARKGQQEKPSAYWDPRGGDRSLSTRRDSMARHDSLTSNTRPVGLTRTPSKRRTSISQPDPPVLDAQVPAESYRPSSSRKRAPPPLSFPANFNQDHARLPSARRPSLSQDNPFAAASSMMSPSSASQDPWDLRNVGSALPSARPLGDGRYPTMPSRGYVDAFATDSESPDDHPPVYASRTGLSRKGSKRKH